MPNAQCPMPNARRVPHVTEKGYIMLTQESLIQKIRIDVQPSV